MVKFTPPDKNDSLTRIVLDGVQYFFRFSFNVLGDFWTVGFYDGNKNPLIAGIKIVPNFPINYFIWQFIDFPGGALMVWTKNERIGRDDFTAGEAEMYYLTEDERKALQAEAENG